MATATQLVRRLGLPLANPDCQDRIRELKRGRMQHGERDPVEMALFPDGHEELLDGFLREAAGWKSRKQTRVKDRLEYFERYADKLNHRSPEPGEWEGLFAAYAEELERREAVPAEKIAAYIYEHLSPFESRDYTYSKINRRYKDTAHGGRPSFQSPETQNEIPGRLPKEFEMSEGSSLGAQTTYTEVQHYVSCPNCGFKNVPVPPGIFRQ